MGKRSTAWKDVPLFPDLAPRVRVVPRVGPPRTARAPAMTLRDYFAGQTIQGIFPNDFEPAHLAETAYAIADAMLAERSKPKPDAAPAFPAVPKSESK